MAGVLGGTGFIGDVVFELRAGVRSQIFGG